MSQETKEIWHNCCKQLKTILSVDIYDRWIAVIKPVSLEDNKLKLAVANDFYKDWLEENYLPLIDKSLILIGQENITALIDVDVKSFDATQKNESASTEIAKKDRPLRISKSKNNLNPAYTFDSFVIGENNRFAHAAAMAAATSPSRTYNPLFIYGGVGLGKTHLMQSIGNYVIQQKSRAKVCYITCESVSYTHLTLPTIYSV